MAAVDDELLARLRAQPRAARLFDALASVEGAHLVGGAVRDVLLGGEAVDLDVVVEGDAAAAARTAAERLGGSVREHERFGTATVEADDVAFDVARARRERYPAPGALPDVEPAPLREAEPNAALHLAQGLGLDRALHPMFVPDSEAAETAQALLPAEARGDLVVLAAGCRAFEREALATWLDELEFPATDREVAVGA